MKNKLCVIGFFFVALMFLGGCFDGDDGQQTSQETSTDTPEAQDGDEVLKPEVLLAQGDAVLGGSNLMYVRIVYPPEPGTLRGTLIWSSPPDELTAYFRKDAKHGIVTGTSPLTTEHHVSVAWEWWCLTAANNSGTDAYFAYVVMFRPD